MKQVSYICVVFLAALVVFTGISNIARQVQEVERARKYYLEARSNLEQMREANNQLEARTSEATSSATLEEKARVEYGVGKAGDAFIQITPEVVPELEDMRVQDETKLRPAQEWIELFRNWIINKFGKK